jgi:hypothetical protein
MWQERSHKILGDKKGPSAKRKEFILIAETDKYLSSTIFIYPDAIVQGRGLLLENSPGA